MYLSIIRFNFLRFQSYPLEAIAVVIRRVLELFFLLLFWKVVANSGNNLDFRSLAAYFCISTAIHDVVNLRYAAFLTDHIKAGTFNYFLIRPVSLIRYTYADNVGQQSMAIIVATASFLLGLAINPILTPLGLLLFIPAMIISLLISLSFNLFVSVLAFHLTEVKSIRHICEHVINVLAGVWVPLTLFPDTWRALVELTPFPALVYTPIQALQATSVSSELLHQFSIGAIWAMVLLLAFYSLWKRALRTYEAVGI